MARTHLQAGDEGRDGKERLQAGSVRSHPLQQSRLRCGARPRLGVQMLQNRAEQQEVLTLLVAHLRRARDRSRVRMLL